ncbi:MAG: SPASM domain-containing protein, partial [Treponema sp.]|nr:SPASM domain-containing protein [Treponema sp.]
MKQLHTLIKPASSLCNMRCSYCFYADISARRQSPSKGIMTSTTAAGIINNIFKDLSFGDSITFAFQGGEPALAGLSWYQDFTSMVADQSRGRDIKIRYAFQTNGLLLDETWCELFHTHHVLVGLSLDIIPSLHDKNRITPDGSGTYREVMRCKELLEKYKVPYNILCVLTNQLAREPDKAWRFILQEKIGYIQFIPCLEGSGEAAVPNVLNPVRFSSFYSRIFHWWAKSLEAGQYISIKFFDDIANLFFRNLPGTCGITGRCQAQFVIEADGSVYPCDFYALDAYNLGNLTEQTLREIFDAPGMRSFLTENPKVPHLCGTCAFYRFCRGGCKRMRDVMYCGPAGVVCGYKLFLEKRLNSLEDALRSFTPCISS